MVISHLVLRQFRNINKMEIYPEAGFNILWGDNAQGKTNILEAIYLLGSLKSFRAAGNEEMILQGREGCRLEAEIRQFEVNRRVNLTITAEGKKARVDEKDIRRVNDFFGHLQPVLFAPEEIYLIKGPAGRRALLDRAIFQTDFAYLERARDFDRHLRQRNRLLREAGGKAELAAWNEGFIHSGARVRLARYLYLERLRGRVQEIYRRISGKEEEANLTYPAGGGDEKDLFTALTTEMEKVAERERRQGQSLVGPHRDDVEFSIDRRSLRLFGSQGQQRSFLLAFKTAQVQDLEEKSGEPPVLLLDDMTSELDSGRQNYFFRYLTERSGQVFITTTDVAPLRTQEFSRGRFFQIREGGLHHDSQG